MSGWHFHLATLMAFQAFPKELVLEGGREGSFGVKVCTFDLSSWLFVSTPIYVVGILDDVILQSRLFQHSAIHIHGNIIIMNWHDACINMPYSRKWL